MKMNENEIEQNDYDDEYANTKTKLLCTFTSKSKCSSIINRIGKAFNIDRRRIFVLRDTNIDPNRYILTYNIIIPKDDVNFRHDRKVPNTIPINRKKDYSCLYTLDALNYIIEQKTGQRNRDIQVEWEKYKNCFLSVNKEDQLIIANTVLDRIEII